SSASAPPSCTATWAATPGNGASTSFGSPGVTPPAPPRASAPGRGCWRARKPSPANSPPPSTPIPWCWSRVRAVPPWKTSFISSSRSVADAALACRLADPIPDRVRGVQVPDPPGHPRGAHCPRHLPAARALDDPHPQQPADRPGGAQRRAPEPPEQIRHPHHGGRADPDGDLRLHPAVVRPGKPLRVGGAGGDLRLRRGGLGGRLPQGGAEEFPGAARPLEVLLAVHRRPR